MDLQQVAQSELEAIEGGNTALASFRIHLEVNSRFLPPGSTVELNPQPLPPRERVMAMRL